MDDVKVMAKSRMRFQEAVRLLDADEYGRTRCLALLEAGVGELDAFNVVEPH